MLLLNLFSSRTRVKLLGIFLLHPLKKYFVRELTRLTGEQINSVRRELENLMDLGLLLFEEHMNKKYYKLDKSFVILEELTGIFAKLSDDRHELIQSLKQIGDIDVLAFSDKLYKAESSTCDVLLIGTIKDKVKLREIFHELEVRFSRELKYVLFDKSEFLLRHSCHDKFLLDFFTSNPLVIIDKIKLNW